MNYETYIRSEVSKWRTKMLKKPHVGDRLTKGVQNKVNGWIPEKVHQGITEVIKQMTKAVLLGSEVTTGKYIVDMPLRGREKLVDETILFYKKSATISGAGTGAGGIFLGMADFPILMTLKLKMLFEIAGLYGYDVKDVRERLFILNIFQLAFSSKDHRREMMAIFDNWETYIANAEGDLQQLNWRKFQQEYRDYIDLAKMLQLVPVVGIAVGAYANNRLVEALGETAKNVYRQRKLMERELKKSSEYVK